ncbi:MAG: hypothetical protein R3D81_09415 [Thalassovita sp.]
MALGDDGNDTIYGGDGDDIAVLAQAMMKSGAGLAATSWKVVMAMTCWAVLVAMISLVAAKGTIRSIPAAAQMTSAAAQATMKSGRVPTMTPFWAAMARTRFLA